MKLSCSINRGNRKQVAVIKNSLTRQEADQIADKWTEQKSARMSLAETLAHAAQFQKVEQAAE